MKLAGDLHKDLSKGKTDAKAKGLELGASCLEAYLADCRAYRWKPTMEGLYRLQVTIIEKAYKDGICVLVKESLADFRQRVNAGIPRLLEIEARTLPYASWPPDCRRNEDEGKKRTRRERMAVTAVPTSRSQIHWWEAHQQGRRLRR